MSLLFVKSADDRQQSTVHNPNTPSRFSNYLTQPLKIPPNSQVSYVSSQFSISADGVLPDDDSFMLTSTEDNAVLDQAVKYTWSNDKERTFGGLQQTLSNYTHSANEAEMDSDYTNTKYVDDVATGTKGVPNYGHIAVYNSINNKAILNTLIRPTIDQFNLDFNASSTNTAYLGGSWNGGGGATVPAGLNFTNKVDTKFQQDCFLTQRNSPNGISTFHAPSCYGYKVGDYTNAGNALTRIYAGGANFYNTGYASNGLITSAYKFGGAFGASLPLPSFSDGNYGVILNTTGIKKSVGNFTPSVNAQQSNGGGHTSIGALQSGGYVVLTQTNIGQNLADDHYTEALCGVGNKGFTGIAPQFFGIHSVPYIQQRGFEEAIKNGVPKQTALYDFNVQVDNWLPTIDLNNSPDSINAVNGDARYLFGIDIVPIGTAPNVDLICVPKVLDTINGTIKNSEYVDLTINNDFVGELSIKQLSKGINTAVVPPYTFDVDAKYSINTYNTDVLRTPASLFFRFRWENKNQICCEFTLNVEGVEGGYDPATDEPYAPATIPSVPPVAVGANIDVLLDGVTNGSIVNIGNDTITFLDSGGAGGGYQPNEVYDIVFQAPAGHNAILTFNDMDIEMTGTDAFDRLGIQTSDDGVTWANVNIVGLNNMSIADNPALPNFQLQQQYNGGSWTADPEQRNGGWIVPSRPTIFQINGGVIGQEYNLGKQYVKFRFLSNGNRQQTGWDMTIKSLALTPENDPRDKWCFLGRMNLINIEDNIKYLLPTYMGDCTVVSYPVAFTANQTDFRVLQKGHYNVRQSNRFFKENNNFGTNVQGISNQPAPYSADNIFFKGANSLGVLTYDQFNPFNSNETSQQLINAEYDGTPSTPFNTDGILSVAPEWLGTRLGIDSSDFKSFRGTDGLPAFGFGQPSTEMAYVLGFLSKLDFPAPIVLDVNPLITDGREYEKQGKNTIQPTNESFSNHYQITNLPIISQNGVVSSMNKTIYIANSLCINDIQDDSKYRFYCDKSPFPIWIDLNNYEEIQLNKIDVLITQDNNTEQTALEGETQVVLQFRQKETGGLPNTIPVKSMPFTRTY